MISERFLIPQIVVVKGKVQFVDAFCGSYVTFAVSKDGHVYGFGLSNYHQLGQYHQRLEWQPRPHLVTKQFCLFFFKIFFSGTKNIKTCFFPVKLACFKNSTTSWVEFSGGQHHTVCLDDKGTIQLTGFSCARSLGSVWL